MTLNELAREIAKREGKKLSVSIAQIKEILAILSDILCQELGEAVNSPTLCSLELNGRRRAGQKKAKKRR